MTRRSDSESGEHRDDEKTIDERGQTGRVAADEEPSPEGKSSPRTVLGVGEARPPGLRRPGVTPASMGGGDGNSEAEEENSFIGREFAGYRVVSKLAEGGMGEIFVGEHVQLGRRAALKFLKLEFCRDEQVVERFTQEARAVNAIRHENIIDVYDIGRDDEGRVFFVMELLEGEPLDERISRGAIPWSEALLLLERTLRALSAAHEKGFVHRDLKPENIFLRRRDDGKVTVKVLDFGIAKLTAMGRSQRLTQTGAIMGTPHYMSPEQIDGSPNVDHRTDIYALGIIIYEMLTGSRPFASETLTAILSDHLFTAPARLEPEPALGVPAGVADIVERMLAKEAADRYASVDDVLSDLRDVDASKAPRQAKTLSREKPLSKAEKTARHAAAGERPRGRGALAWLAALGAAAALSLGIFALGQRGDSAAERPAPQAATEAPEPAPLDLREVRERAQSFLRASLEEPEPRLRVQASDALGVVRDDDSVPALIERVQADPDLEVRGHAAGALGEIGDPEAAPALEEAREQVPSALAVWLDEALRKLGGDGARDRLVQAAGDESLEVSFKAALALADASEPGDEEAIGVLTRLASREAELQDIHPYAGISLLFKLAALRHEPAREGLLEALEHPDEGARMSAADALARLGDDAGRDVLERILADEASPNRIAAARALIALGDYSGFEFLVERLAAPEPAVRRQAARGLGEIGERDGARRLVELLDDDERSVGIAAATALILIAGLDAVLLAQSSVDWARSALGAEDGAARSAAARTLGDLEDEVALPLLAQVVVDEDPQVRKEAARSAGRMRGPRVAREVARAARQEQDEEVLETQVVALAEIADPEGKEALEEISGRDSRPGVLASGAILRLETDESALGRLEAAIRGPRVDLRLAAADGATLSRNPRAVSVLTTGIEDQIFDVRFSSAVGLAEYRAASDRAIPVLEEGLEREDVDTQVKALIGLRKIGVSPEEILDPREMLASPSAVVRRAALPLLADLPWDEALPPLRLALASRDVEVRRGAVDVVADAAADHEQDAQRLFRGLVDDDDGVTRTKARAQLARLVEPDGVELTDTAPAGPDPEAVAALEARLAEATEAEQAFGRSLEEARAIAAQIEERTASPAESDEDVDEVSALADRAEAAGRRAVAAKDALAEAVMRAREAAKVIQGPLSVMEAGNLSDLEVAAADAVARRDEARHASERARTLARSYARAQTADPALYLTSARTSTATGNLRSARRDLRRAERLFAAQGEVPTEVHFAYGELYARMSLDADSDEARTGHLGRAAQSFERVVAGGQGVQVEQARERLGEIRAELDSLDPDGE